MLDDIIVKEKFDRKSTSAISNSQHILLAPTNFANLSAW